MSARPRRRGGGEKRPHVRDPARAVSGRDLPGDRREAHGRRFRAAVLVFFLTSGATGLALEVVWTRILGVVFGNTVYAASTVLTAYMLGLALGSAALGSLADRARRPLVLYGLLEIGVGLYALVLPLLAAGTTAVYGWFFRSFEPAFWLLNLVRFGLSVLVLLPPTFLMGGTLPVLARHLGLRHRQPGREVGYLYGANTLGAVVGCFLAGFVLLEALGVRGTLLTAGAVALCVGLLAVVLGRRSEAPTEPAQPSLQSDAARKAAPLPKSTHGLLLIAFGLTGFCALACEVLWTRVLIFVLTCSVYSFATMLTAFLSGIAVGSLLSSRFLVPRARRGVLWFGAIEVLVGLSILGSIYLLAALNRIDLRLAEHLRWGGQWQAVLTRFGDAFGVLFVPALLMGAAFPMVTKSCLRGKALVGRQVGRIYAANTVGCLLGSFAAGFLLLPALGTPRAMLLVASVNLAVAVALLWHGGMRSVLARALIAPPVAAVVVAAFLGTPADVFHKTINAYHHPSRIAFLEEHATGTVAVHNLPNGERLISVDGVNVAGLDFMLRSTQKLQGYIPLCLHPDPQRVVQIGFGSGETTRVGLEFGVRDYTIVEICPAVFDAGRHFEEINHGSYRDPRLRKIIMDGKNFALLTGERFDVVMNDSTYPGSSGSSALYTVDHFRNCRRLLTDGGLLSCWVPLDLRPRELRMILKSFQAVFPHCSFWVASNCLNKHALILGTLSPLRIDFARVRSAMSGPHVAADLRAIAIHDVYDLLDCHVYDAAVIRRLTRNDPLNSDDRPRLEFSCAIRAPEERALTSALAMLAVGRVPVAPYVVNFAEEARDRAELARRFHATNCIFRGQIAQLVGDPQGRRRQFALALAANPAEAHVATCDAELQRETRDLQAALARMPHHRTLAMRLAGKLYVACRYEEAARIYERLVDLRPPPPPRAFVRLANIHFRFGRAAKAEGILRECLVLWPGSAEAHDMLAGVFLRTGRAGAARRHSAEALRLAPGNLRYRAHYQAALAAERGRAASQPAGVFHGGE